MGSVALSTAMIWAFFDWQSNEAGTGCGQYAASASTPATQSRGDLVWGTPIANINGTTQQHGIATDVVDWMAGYLGYDMRYTNVAVGGTGIVQQWSGLLGSWSANTAVIRGTWVLVGGFKYKSITVTTANTGASQPAWPTTVGATVTDGGITWQTYATDSNDVLNHMYNPGESGYDPNGYVANLIAGITNAVAKGYRPWIFSSGGQADTSLNWSAAQISLGQINLFNLCLAAGADRIFAAITPLNQGASTAPDWAKPNGKLQVALDQVMAYFTGNSKVRRGADMSAVVPTIMITDSGLHRNRPGIQSLPLQQWKSVLIANPA